MLLALVVITLGNCAFAQVSTLRHHPSNTPDFRWMATTAEDVSGIERAMEDYSKIIELSDMTTGRGEDIMSKTVWLNDDSVSTEPVLSWETGAGKSYLIPALEIPGFVLALNGAARVFRGDKEEDGKKVFSTTPSTFWDHVFHGHWGGDRDSYTTNQFGHPYQGSVYHGSARSTGLNFWESLGYAFVGSLLWETAGETTPPSINDQITSGIAGSFLGEPLFRMAGLLLERGGGEPGFWRELGAAVLSPPTGFNRLVFGDRFKDVFPSDDPAIFQRLRVGGGTKAHVLDPDGLSLKRRNQVTVDYSLSYGLPGKPSYSYKRPFDYFQFELTIVNRTRNPLDRVITRGLVLGQEYEAGSVYRGVWGLYVSHDYMLPESVRISSSAASLGTTAQWWLGPPVALQGTVLGGIGYGAAGRFADVGERDHRFGMTGQGLLELRLILGEVALLEVTGREYYVSGLASRERGRDAIGLLDVGLITRIYGRHCLGLQYAAVYRDARTPDIPDGHQKEGALSLVYTLLSDTRFGAVEWRNPAGR